MDTLPTTYQQTHPWLTFALDLRSTNPDFWMLVGEARSKCQHLALTPLKPAIAHELHQVYLAKGALATTAIEGNTLSEDQARQAVEGELTLPPSQAYLQREVENIIAACNRIAATIDAGESFTITPESIRDLNRLVLDGLELPEDVEPGVLRKHSVGVAGYRGAPWQDCDHLLAQLSDWLASDTFAPTGDPRHSFTRAVCGAIAAHLYMAWIHPFGDGNGRTARLLEFGILVQSGVPFPAAHLLSNHYNQTRTEYYRQLDSTSRSGGAVVPFFLYAVQGFVDQLVDQIRMVTGQHLDSAWESFVSEQFAERRASVTSDRRHRLVMDMTAAAAPVPRSQLMALSPALAQAYAGKSQKTLSRDLNALVSMELIEKAEGGYRARAEKMLALLPGGRTTTLTDL
jgi:Fic family protein